MSTSKTPAKSTAPILDPRGEQKRPLLNLAPRITMQDLERGPILFFDNTKLGFCNYMEVFRRLKANFPKDGITNLVEHRESVRGKSTDDLRKFAEKLAAYKPKAAIFALGDVGVSPATTIMTIRIEELGIPTVYITAPPGSDLVKGVVYYRAGRLAVCPIWRLVVGWSFQEQSQDVSRHLSTGHRPALLSDVHCRIDDDVDDLPDACRIFPERDARRHLGTARQFSFQKDHRQGHGHLQHRWPVGGVGIADHHRLPR
jgi:hypothetical protein